MNLICFDDPRAAQAKGPGRPVSRILLYPAIHLREESLPGSSWRSRAYQSGVPRRFGLLAPVVYLAGPSRDTAGGLLPHPFTHHLCRRLGPRPSAGLLSVALDVAAGLRRTAPRVVGPSGLSGPGSPQPSRVRTLLYAAGGASSAMRRSDGSDGPNPGP